MSTGVSLPPQMTPERCPWCGSGISRSKFIEIQTRIADEERKKLAEERARIEEQFRLEQERTEVRLREEADKKLAAVTTERDQAALKLKQIEAHEAQIRKEAVAQAEARAKAEADKKLAALTTERDQAALKLKQIEAAKQKDLEQQRASLERDGHLQLQKLQSQNNREREQLQQKIDGLTRQLQKKTASELGDGGEIDVYEALHAAFPGDDITRVKKGHPGADIIQAVIHKGDRCGSIVIDSKNRQGWLGSYVTKLRQDQMTAKAEHAILATAVFPSGKKELFIDGDTSVIVVNPARAVEIVGLLRSAMVQMHVLGLTHEKRTEKRDQLYAYISSDGFRQHLWEARRLTDEILDVDVDEKRAHDKIWAKRGTMVTRMKNVVRQIDTEVSAILEKGLSPTSQEE